MSRANGAKESGTTAGCPAEMEDGVARVTRRIDVSSHFNYGSKGFDKMKLARIEREANRNWLTRLICRLFDCYRAASD